MSIIASELIAYGSASMPDDDTPQNIGGAIDTSIRIAFTDLTVAGLVEVVSSNAGDTTQTVTVYGRNAAGELISEVKTLNGTTPVDFTSTFERLLKAVINASHTGTVTLRKDGAAGDLMVFEPGVLQIRRPFYNAAAEASGGSQRKYYEKVFFKNTNGSLTLTGAVIAEQADPTGNVAFALESSLNGSDTNGASNNRQVAPGGYTFNSTTKNVANSQNLTSGAAQGIWLELTLAAGAAAADSSFTLRCSGNTT